MNCARGKGIVVVGSLHYDIVVEAPNRPRKGETVMGDRWFPKFGGKGGNQAVAAARAGGMVKFVGAVGADGFSGLLRDTLQSEGMDTGRVATVPGIGSGMSVATMDAGGDYGAVVVSGANRLIDAAQFDDPALWTDGAVLILQNEVPEAVNLAAARAAKAHGMLVCVNAAPSRTLAPSFLSLIDILIVNGVEAEDMGAGAVTDLDGAVRAAEALARQVPIAVVTAGSCGVAWATRGGATGSQPARKVKLVSTHGAGDTFIGTLCAALAEGRDVARAITAANEAAARHVSTRQG